MDSKAYFEKVMQDFNQFREGRSLRKYCSMALSKLRDNAIECAVRTLTTQRNNMLHFGSDEGAKMAATYHSIISTVKLQGRSAWDYLGKFFVNIFNGCRDFSVCDQINFRANESRAKLVRAMPSAAENHEINRIGNMPIVNKQMKILTSLYIGTCKSAYTKGYALN